MKQKIRLGDCYALTIHKLKEYKIKYLSLLAVATIMCLYAVKQVSAQQAEPAAPAVADIKPLQVGDTLPEWLWHYPLQVVNHQEGKDTITLIDYRGKLIILDFWATWCGACLLSMPSLDSLSAAYREELSVLLVNAKGTRDSPEKINAFFNRRRENGTSYSFPSVITDTVLSQTFKHTGIPYVVWVNQAGVVLAATGSDEVTAANIEKVIKGRSVDFKEKVKSTDVGLLSTNLLQASVFTGYNEHMKERMAISERDGLYSKINFNNLHLRTIINYAFPEAKSFAQNRILIETDQPVQLSTRYCYQLLLHHPKPLEQVRQIMKADLANFLNCNISMEKRQRKCLLLKVDNPQLLPITSGLPPDNNLYEPSASAKFMDNHAVSAIIDYLNKISPYPILDSTGLSEHLDMVLPNFEQPNTSSSLNQALKKYGLSLVEEERPINVLVMSDKLYNVLKPNNIMP